MMTASNLRIVSLLPSATEIVAALGLTDAIVGRSHECDYPPEIQDRPVCTEAQLNSEKLSRWNSIQSGLACTPFALVRFLLRMAMLILIDQGQG